jgi:uncharacterized membrane-anchored protein YitT (DUF2179 family)
MFLLIKFIGFKLKKQLTLMRNFGGEGMIWLQTKKSFVVIMGAFLVAISMNLFLIPANVYSSGFAGVAQLLSKVISEYTPYIFLWDITFIA